MKFFYKFFSSNRSWKSGKFVPLFDFTRFFGEKLFVFLQTCLGLIDEFTYRLKDLVNGSRFLRNVDATVGAHLKAKRKFATLHSVQDRTVTTTDFNFAVVDSERSKDHDDKSSRKSKEKKLGLPNHQKNYLNVKVKDFFMRAKRN